MKSRQPPVIFISKEGIATFWFLVSAVTILGAGIYAERLASTKGIRPQFIGMDTPGTAVRMIPEKSMADPEVDSEKIISQTRLLADSVYNKSAGGLDASDRCQRMMTKEVWDWVQEHLVNAQKDAFREGSMHQKVALENIDVQADPDDPSKTVAISGQLIRTGILNREIFNQVWALKASVVWERNPSLRDCGRFPFICTTLNARETPISSTQRHLTVDEESSISARAAAEQAAQKAGGAESTPAKP